MLVFLLADRGREPRFSEDALGGLPLGGPPACFMVGGRRRQCLWRSLVTACDAPETVYDLVLTRFVQLHATPE